MSALLEQSSSHAVRVAPGYRTCLVDQSSSVVLAVSLSICDRVDGREPLRARSLGVLWPRIADGGDCVLDLAAGDHRLRRFWLGAQESSWQGLEGKAFSSALCRGHRREPLVS